MPAVQADQVFIWNQDVIMSYLGLAEIVESVTEAIATSSIVTAE
jgi:hypothetical protein